MLPQKLHPWVPAKIRFAVRESSVDNDGYWLYLFDEYEVDGGSTVSGDTKAEAVEYFMGGRWNEALSKAYKERAVLRPKAKTKAQVKLIPGPLKVGDRPAGITDLQWTRYINRVNRWNASVTARG